MKKNDFEIEQKFYAYDAKSITNNIQLITKKVRTELKKLDRELEKIEFISQDEEEKLDRILAVDSNALCDDNSIWELSDKLVFRLRWFLNFVNGYSCLPPQRDLFTGTKAEDDLFKKVIIPADQIETHLEPDAVFVRLPMLGSLQTESDYKNNTLRISTKHLRLYRKSIIKSIELHPLFQAYDFQKYKKKIVHFLFVYNQQSENANHMIDNDNHDLKSVVDAITFYTGSGDGPLVCKIFIESALYEGLPEGTYVTMTSTEQGLLPEQKIISFWKENLYL